MCKDSQNSLSVPMKFYPLSLNISLGFSVGPIKCLKVRRKTSVVKSEANSIWTADAVKHLVFLEHLT